MSEKTFCERARELCRNKPQESPHKWFDVPCSGCLNELHGDEMEERPGLDGYRELGSKCAEFENSNDGLRQQLAKAQPDMERLDFLDSTEPLRGEPRLAIVERLWWQEKERTVREAIDVARGEDS